MNNNISNLSNIFSVSTIWSAVGKYSNFLIQFIIGIILSRILTPEEFGVVAMVLVFSGFLSIISNFGLGSSIIQFKSFDDADISTIFWISLLLGLIISLIFLIISNFVAFFYKMEKLSIVTKVISPIFLINALSVVPISLLQKNFKFKLIAIINIVAAIISGIIAIVLALKGYKYWSLVYQIITNSLIITLLSYKFAKWYPLLKFNRDIIRKVLNYSGNLSLFDFINYWARNADNLLIGKILGAGPLGFYNRAYSIMLYPINFISGIINPVLHPILSTIQNDKQRIYIAYLKIIKFIGLLCLPLMVTLGLLSNQFILVIWGNQWGESAHIFRILCIVGAIQPILYPSGTMFLVLNKPGLLVKVGGINAVIMVSGIIIGLNWGVVGVAIGYSIGYGIIVLPTLYIITNRLLNGSLFEVFKVLANAFYLSAIIIIIQMITFHFFSIQYSIYTQLILGILISLTLFVAFNLIFEKEFLLELHKKFFNK